MIDAQAPVQAAIVTAIKASAAAKALIGDPARIYDKVPTNQGGVVTATYPFSSFGPFQSLDDSDACHAGVEVFVQIDSWSRAVGRVEAARIGAALALLLDAPIIVPDFEIIIHEVEGLETRAEQDGLTHRSMLRLRYVLAPSA